MENEKYIEKYTSHKHELSRFINETKINRPSHWKDLDIEKLKKELGYLTSYEHKMVMNTCETYEIAIMAVKRYRDDMGAYRCFLRQVGTEQKTDQYRRKKYRDTEEELEDE